ncbi:cysteine desulfurase family protein [Oceanobacillus manasiensis]|uniref:cysteine desulfurase family protein n=1 Tax=Oceanobacillus manasiensis TaxID=586413 RepID=UPI0005A69186|nr:cysteine desulfurase family protein [Oceanobacillus manasiensis]
MIYLDNSATTKPDPGVLKSFEQISSHYFANPSSIHPFGGEAEKLLNMAKKQAAELLKVRQEEVVFTSGGTEGNNMAIKGIALQHQQRGKHVITTEIEHPSVFEACKSLETLGFDVTYLPVDQSGVVSVKDIQKAIREDTILISVMHVNNELGSIQPIKEIADLAATYPKIFFHVDDVQGLGKVPLSLSHPGINLCTISGHKINGLKGTGILYVDNRTTLFPLFHGGEQERNLRSGTENVAGSVSIVKALRLIKDKETSMLDHLYEVQAFLLHRLKDISEVDINTAEKAAPHIVNFSVPGIKPEVIIHMLAEKEIFISTKSACSSKQSDESKILAACGFSRARTISALRVSLSFETTKEEIQHFIDNLKKAINQFKKVME